MSEDLHRLPSKHFLQEDRAPELVDLFVKMVKGSKRKNEQPRHYEGFAGASKSRNN